jgi:hypothetical protein
LQKVDLGIELWLNDQPIEEDDPYRRSGEEEPLCDSLVLGYCYVDGQWQLATKTVTLGTDEEGTQFSKTLCVTHPSALLKSPRKIRIKAMALVGDLIRALEEEAKRLVRLLESIDSAKSAAASQ